MTLLVSAQALEERRAVARGALAPLANGLRRELEPLLAGGVDIPAEKAMLSRAGGRCDRDGTLLEYDPFDARHRCPQCGKEVVGVEHDRFRLYWHHLWLAERVLHGALLGRLLDDPACTALAGQLLDRYAERYLAYPNLDNVLGPSRPFFSTYLESIWLLQLALALDLLEDDGAHGELGGRVRDRLIAPSAALVASYDEGMSNRQVWNNAALLAAGRLLGDEAMVGRAVSGNSGLHEHLRTALLADGSWYEGENYHLFAHRGLWYGVLLSEQAGVQLPSALASRFMDGFAAPFRTVQPDLTYPSRRDSQYAISVRQPRFAESCELGLARGDDPRLVGMLARLYDPSVPRTRVDRARTSADVERNGPATGLTRADLSWRSLLVARESLPPLQVAPLASDLLPAQGIAILRRGERIYAALDYGHDGGGHGHPDRLNVLLMDGATRWFDDPGTGSYVDPTLHWYRSTLAHTAPLVDGRSQPRVHGSLVAFDAAPRAAWASGDVELSPGLHIRRSIVLLDDYLVDLLQWDGDAEHELALPLHGVDLVDEHDRPLPRVASPIEAGDGLEDGFDFLTTTARIGHSVEPIARVLGTRTTQGGTLARLRGWIRPAASTTWWSADAPDVPGRAGRVPLLLWRATGQRGAMAAVWSWSDAVTSVVVEADAIQVHRRDGRRDMHAAVASGWRIDLDAGGARETVILGGLARAPSVPATEESKEKRQPIALPATMSLGEAHYRRSESGWREAGAPRADVEIRATESHELVLTVTVAPSHRIFVPEDAVNALDNETAAINGDGVQLYARCEGREGAWLLVPRAADRSVAVHPIAGWKSGLSVSAEWHPTSKGYALTARVALPRECPVVELDLLVNETAPGRARRRGQLVLSGAKGEFVYLRGDRHDRRQLLRFTL
ncbi:MAG TPA: heparinase II/III family protein [Gemmatimonadaceae bacterium]|nr:heparinase II/III family protein [Gemmatimonadaceae bacterium]